MTTPRLQILRRPRQRDTAHVDIGACRHPQQLYMRGGEFNRRAIGGMSLSLASVGSAQAQPQPQPSDNNR